MGDSSVQNETLIFIRFKLWNVRVCLMCFIGWVALVEYLEAKGSSCSSMAASFIFILMVVSSAVLAGETYVVFND